MLSVATLVTLLLGACGPTAVLWRIRTVVVDAINRMFVRRSSAHVGQEGFVGVSPSGADLNASPAVASVARALWICAALNDASPCLKFWRPVAASRLAVCGQRGAAVVPLIAATTSRLAAMQQRPTNDSFSPAITPAQPMATWALGFCSRQHGPSSETLADGNRHSTRLDRLQSPFATCAAATSNARTSSSQVSTASHALPAAIALTKPVGARTWIVNRPEYDEPVEPLSGQIHALHPLIITGVRCAPVA